MEDHENPGVKQSKTTESHVNSAQTSHSVIQGDHAQRHSASQLYEENVNPETQPRANQSKNTMVCDERQPMHEYPDATPVPMISDTRQGVTNCQQPIQQQQYAQQTYLQRP